MYFKMIEISTVCGLVKEQFFLQQHLPTSLSLPDFSHLSLNLSLFVPYIPQNKQEEAKQQSDQAYWNFH